MEVSFPSIVQKRMVTPAGSLLLTERDGALSSVQFLDVPCPLERAEATEEASSPLLEKARRELLEYFQGTRWEFDLPLAPYGTPFQLKVWSALKAIPYGQTRTYGQIAQAVGNPKAARAVGMANHHNPLAILIPCHRVVGARGKLTGYAGGLDRKAFLLELERSYRK